MWVVFLGMLDSQGFGQVIAPAVVMMRLDRAFQSA